MIDHIRSQDDAVGSGRLLRRAILSPRRLPSRTSRVRRSSNGSFPFVRFLAVYCVPHRTPDTDRSRLDSETHPDATRDSSRSQESSPRRDVSTVETAAGRGGSLRYRHGRTRCRRPLGRLRPWLAVQRIGPDRSPPRRGRSSEHGEIRPGWNPSPAPPPSSSDPTRSALPVGLDSRTHLGRVALRFERTDCPARRLCLGSGYAVMASTSPGWKPRLGCANTRDISAHVPCDCSGDDGFRRELSPRVTYI